MPPGVSSLDAIRRPPQQRRWRPLLLTLLLLAPLVAGCLGPGDGEGDHVLVDDTGNPVDVSDVTRIVATSHDLVETLFLMGHGDKVAAVPDWIDHPEGIEGLPRLGRPHVIGAEEVLAVDATLVLEKDHPLQPTPLAASLRAAGVPVFVFDNTEDLDNVRHTFETVGRILAHADPEAPAKAASLWADFADQVDTLRSTVANSTAPTPRAVYQLPVGFVSGRHTSADVLLELAGATNVARTLGIDGYRQVNDEALVSADVERVVATTSGGYAPPHVFFNDPSYRDSTAAVLGPETLRPVDPAATALVGPRFVDGARLIAQWLHPVAFGLIGPNVTKDTKSTDDGVRLDVDPTASTALHPPLRFRFLAGDGTPAADGNATFTHTYTTPGPHTARLLVIDAEGHLHEERLLVET